jgi:hypothetical protein
VLCKMVDVVLEGELLTVEGGEVAEAKTSPTTTTGCSLMPTANLTALARKKREDYVMDMANSCRLFKDLGRAGL